MQKNIKQAAQETLTATSNEFLVASGMLALGGISLVKGIENGSAAEILLGSLAGLGSIAVAATGFLRRQR